MVDGARLSCVPGSRNEETEKKNYCLHSSPCISLAGTYSHGHMKLKGRLRISVVGWP